MKVKGIALIQILILVAILSVFLLAITADVRNQIKIAQIYSDKTKAMLKLKSAESELLFELLTKNKNDVTKLLGELLPINFYGKMVEYSDGIFVSIQDQAGLIDIHLATEPQFYRMLLPSKGESQATYLAESLYNWQDKGEGSRLFAEFGARVEQRKKSLVPTLFDFIHTPLINEQEIGLIEENFTLNSPGFFNPQNAPVSVINVYFEEYIAQTLVSQRNAGDNDFQKFRGEFNFNDESILFITSNNLEVAIVSIENDIEFKKVINVKLDPYSIENDGVINVYSEKN